MTGTAEQSEQSRAEHKPRSIDCRFGFLIQIRKQTRGRLNGVS